MRPKARIKFCKFENALAMQVLYIDARVFQGLDKINPNYVFRQKVISFSFDLEGYLNVSIRDFDFENGLISIPKTYIAQRIELIEPWPEDIHKLPDNHNENLLIKIIESFSWLVANLEFWNGEKPIKPRFWDAMGNEYSSLDDVQGCVVEVEV